MTELHARGASMWWHRRGKVTMRGSTEKGDWRASVAEGGLPSSSLMSPLPLHSPHRSSWQLGIPGEKNTNYKYEVYLAPEIVPKPL